MKKIIAAFQLMSCFLIVSCTETSISNQPTTNPGTTSRVTTTATTTVTTAPTTEETTQVEYENDEPFILQMKNESLKILQLTDLHLTFTADDTATRTLNLIRNLIASDDFDLVVITGDLTYSQIGPTYFLQLITVMEECATPWSFVFGNHEVSYNEYSEFIDIIPTNTEYLRFKVGPELEEGGYGNYVIQFQKNNLPFYDLILMDSHAERTVFEVEEGPYDYIKPSQIAWYESKVVNSEVNNLVFMHIPLRQMYNAEGYVGIFGEYVCPQGIDTGLFDAFVANNKTKGFFCGHDHLNDFYMVKENIILAYGRSTGYGGYGDLEKGASVIEILDNQEIVLSTILGSSVTP